MKQPRRLVRRVLKQPKGPVGGWRLPLFAFGVFFIGIGLGIGIGAGVGHGGVGVGVGTSIFGSNPKLIVVSHGKVGVSAE